MKEKIDNVEIEDFSESELAVEVTESYTSIKEVLEYLLHEIDQSQDYTQIVNALTEATIGLTVKCVSRVAKIMTRLDKIEEVLFNLEVSPQSVVLDQEQLARQVVSMLEVTRKYLSLARDMGILEEGSPKRRRLLDLLESLSDEDVDKLLFLIEEKI